MNNQFKFLLLLILFLLHFVNCNKNPVEYKSFEPEKDIIGKTWAYQILYLSKVNPFFFDTTYNWIFHECVKETTFNDKKWFHFKETVFRRELFNTDTSFNEYAIHIGIDSMYIFDYENNYPVFQIYRNMQQNQFGLINDINGFRYCTIVFPLDDNTSKSWYLNEYDTSSNAFNVKKIYVGQEEINVIGGTFCTWKIKWDWSETWVEDLSRYDWVSENGIVLSETDYGSSLITNEWFDSIGSFNLKENVEYIGEKVENVVITPYYNKTFRDSLAGVILNYWSFEKYSTWLKAHIESNYISSIEGFESYDLDSSRIASLVSSIWGIGFSTLEELNNIIDSAEFPTSIDSLYSLNNFVELVIVYEQFVQGWDDCDLIWQTSGTSTDHPHPFGQSKKKDELLAFLYKH